MKVNLALEKSVASKGYWLVINDDFYIEIKENQFNAISEFLHIGVTK